MGMVENITNKILLCKYTKRVIYGILGFMAGLVFAVNYKDSTLLTNETLKLVLTPSIIFISLVLTAMQFAYNREWNKKDAAHKSIADFSKSYNEIIEELHEIINIRHHIASRTRIKVSDIHNLMGVFSKQDDGTYIFVYHGPTDEEIIPQDKDDAYIRTKKSQIDGRKVERAIIRLLGEFEYICSAVDNEIMDNKTVMDLLAPTIVCGYYVFEYYILHKRHCDRHGGGRGKLYEKFEKIAKDNSGLVTEDCGVEFKDVDKQHYEVPFKVAC